MRTSFLGFHSDNYGFAVYTYMFMICLCVFLGNGLWYVMTYSFILIALKVQRNFLCTRLSFTSENQIRLLF